MITGNKLGFVMFLLSAPVALIGGFFLNLGDPLTMGLVGLWLIIMDVGIRLRNREQSNWLTAKELGGYLYFVPVWGFGIFVVILNIINALTQN